MQQINNGFKEYYYLTEDGIIYDDAAGKQIKPDQHHLFCLRTVDNRAKKIALSTLYKLVYNKKYCIDNIESLDQEIWKDIDSDGLYKISNKGRVKSLKGYKAILLNPYFNKGGYLRVDIIENGKRSSKLVHRLVAAAFLEAPEHIDYQLHHIDFNKKNSAAENLQWLSAADHAKKHFERRKKIGKE